MGRNPASVLAFLSTIVGAGAALADGRAVDLYFRGLTDVTATLPGSGLTITSTTMPCSNCHGADGQGGSEGGVAVPPISWRRLAMATAERPAYDRALLARALRDGIGADGTPLYDIMPRYAIPDTLALELASWLKAIGSGFTPGVRDDEIVIAFPPTKADDARAVVVAKILHYYADKVNLNGGLYGRALRLVEDEPGRENAFARLAALEPHADSNNGLLNLWPLHVKPDGKPTFPLIPSNSRLMQSLLKAAKRDDPTARQLSEIADDGNVLPHTFVFEGSADVLSAFVDGWEGPTSLTIYTTLDHIDLADLQNFSSRPLRLILANPFAVGETSNHSDPTPHLAAFNEAVDQLRLPTIAQPIARAAWVAASLLEDTLRATGRILDQERFKAALESMSTVESGLLSPVHPTRGLTSIELVTFDLSTNMVTRLALALD